MTSEGAGADRQAAALAVCVGESAVRIWGMSGEERMSRIFARGGLRRITAAEAAGSGADGGVLVARADWVVDEKLVRALAVRPMSLLRAPGGEVVAVHVPAGVAVACADALGAGAGTEAPAFAGLEALDLEALSYNHELRKREAPVLELLQPDGVRAVEARTFQGSYKGVTDLVTKYVWPVPARIVTRWCAQARMTPNQVTFAGFLLVLAAFWYFWRGEYGPGLLCAWIMTFLDTVDGKLARVTLQSSKMGNVFDHGIDLIHPPFWWWAWYVGLSAAGTPPAGEILGLPLYPLCLALIVAGYVLQRVEEGIFLALFRVEMHAWRPFDSFFRLITARRNPNLILLSVAWLAGAPDLGFAAVAAWTGICLIVHLVQILQGLATPKGQVVSWLSR